MLFNDAIFMSLCFFFMNISDPVLFMWLQLGSMECWRLGPLVTSLLSLSREVASQKDSTIQLFYGTLQWCKGIPRRTHYRVKDQDSSIMQKQSKHIIAYTAFTWTRMALLRGLKSRQLDIIHLAVCSYKKNLIFIYLKRLSDYHTLKTDFYPKLITTRPCTQDDKHIT